MEKIQTIKSIIYILLLLYCGNELGNNFKDLGYLTEEASITELQENNIFNLSNIQYSHNINNNEVSFTYYEFSLYTYKLIETFLYINIMFMLLIFLSQNSEGVLNLIKNDE